MASLLETEQLPKETKAHGKWYDDACGAAYAIEILGERWSLLIVRELMLGPLRFTDLRAELPGISAKVLTERLQGLEASGVISRRKLDPPANAQVYELTPWGYEADGVLHAMVLWAMRSQGHNSKLHMTAVAFMLTLPMARRPAFASRLQGLSAGFVIGGQRFVARIDSGTVHVERGDAEAQDLVFVGEGANAMLALFYGGREFDAWLAENDGRRIEGDRGRAWAFISAFQWPDKIA